ncbi:hypothetical protein [Sphaerothrix gracilis]|uniref:hypothetical protein n=1 Tax=Sphaerothrix gracilis TaxID=3151835 RepID=UPI0031FCE6FE
MFRNFSLPRWFLIFFSSLGLVVGGWLLQLLLASAPAATFPKLETAPIPAEITPSDSVLQAALNMAEQASATTQTAQTPQDWSVAMSQWAEAMTLMQSVPRSDPQRLFAQRKADEFLRHLQAAQAKAAGTVPAVFPTLGSDILDEQLAGYLSYIAAVGVPDVLIVGSSRALQGVDPQALQQALAQQGFSDPKVFNLGVNGATAQVVNFLVQRLLTPEQLPELILWAGGSRSFNSSRVDRTFAGVLDSPGYQAFLAGEKPSFKDSDRLLTPTQPLDAYGFFPVEQRFNPSTYYQQFPRIAGQYDADYTRFSLDGLQTRSLTSFANFARSQDIPLFFINLPLTQDYLDSARLRRERQFQTYLQQQSQALDFGLIDLVQQWPTQNGYFADPSHLNRYGAAAIAQQLANRPDIPWSVLQTSSDDSD